MSEVRLLQGDCLEVMATLPDNSVDSVITDPPAGIGFMGKDWDHDKGGREQWVAWLSDVLSECLRVAKPGAILLCWALPRTSHWTGLAIEQAGWEVRDRITHLFGSGFPKSMSISKAIDRAAGAEREVVGKRSYAYPDTDRPSVKATSNGHEGSFGQKFMGSEHDITAPATPLAAQWDGWGTALKPAAEDWWLAQKPIQGTYAQNAAEWGVAGLWIDGARVTGQLPSQTTKDIIHLQSNNGGVSWDSAQNLTSIIASIAESVTSLIEQGNSPLSAIENVVSHLSDEQRKTLSATCRMDISCFDGRFREALRSAVNTSTSLNIGTFGKNIMGEKSRPATSSTIRMAISKTIESTILSLCPERNITVTTTKTETSPNHGRWPSNVILDEDSARLLDEMSGETKSVASKRKKAGLSVGNGQTLNRFQMNEDNYGGYEDVGGASRFFYCAKASRAERNRGLEGMPLVAPSTYHDVSVEGAASRGRQPRHSTPTENHHPTVKSLSLMQYLCRLTKTPTGGVVLDPFMGSGSTGCAAVMEGRDFIGIEQDGDYFKIAERRIAAAQAAPEQLELVG